MHFEGKGTLLRANLRPDIAHKTLLQAHCWTAREVLALTSGIVDAIAPTDQMLSVALELARRRVLKAKMGVYSVLRNKLYGDATRAVALISYLHSGEHEEEGYCEDSSSSYLGCDYNVKQGRVSAKGRNSFLFERAT